MMKCTQSLRPHALRRGALSSRAGPGAWSARLEGLRPPDPSLQTPGAQGLDPIFDKYRRSQALALESEN